MKPRNLFLQTQGLLLAILISVLGFGTALASSQVQLNVALYPYVPRIEQFEQALRSEWHKVHPDVQLNFIGSTEWDGGYDFDPPTNADVFVFDALYFDYFRQQSWLEPLAESEISNVNDLLPYARAGVKVGRQYYAIPQLGCASLLFYKKTDTAVANASTLTQLKSTVNQCTYTSRIPPDRRGLMVDMSGGTTDAALYLDTAHSITGEYPYPLPPTPSELDQAAIHNLKKILSIGSYRNATLPPSGAYDFASWYSNGWGRAYVGYSESMSQMSAHARKNVAFKVMPFSDNPNTRPSFYADVIAVNTTVHLRGTRALAVQLANVMAAKATMIKSIGPYNNSPPQYLMATRKSVFQVLGQQFPLYSKMYALTTSTNPVMFKLNENSRSWLASMKGAIKTDVLSNPVCGCDYSAVEPIASNAQAAAICSNTCGAHGGWTGQWTNQPPAAESGSVCGCNSCPSQPESLRTPELLLRKLKGDVR